MTSMKMTSPTSINGVLLVTLYWCAVVVKSDGRQPEVHNGILASSHPGCFHENRTFAPGERYRIDACTTCHCPRHATASTRAYCIVQDCQATQNCFRFAERKSDTECCATCLEYGCLHNGTVFAGDQVVMETPCERCVCSPGGGPVVCSHKSSACPRNRQTVRCVDHVTDPQTCCRRCPNGANCWLDGRVLPQGVTVDVGNCRKCQCPPAGHATPFWRRGRGEHAVCVVEEGCNQSSP